MRHPVQPHWILEKTPKGRDEVVSRAHHLPPPIRSLLILADGQRTARDLLSASTDPLRSQASLSMLLDEGFLQAVAQPAEPPLEWADIQESDRKPLLMALVRQMFGAQAKLLQKFELAQDDPASLKAAIDASCKFVRLFIDGPQADVFQRRAYALLDEHRTRVN
ncbi:MAG: hypothetical protein ACYCSR_05245 [Thiomonas sp.]